MALKTMIINPDQYSYNISKANRSQQIEEEFQNDSWFQMYTDPEIPGGETLNQFLQSVKIAPSRETGAVTTNLGIAIINSKAIGEVLNQASRIIGNIDSFDQFNTSRTESRFRPNAELKAGYQQLEQNKFFDDIAQGKQTSSLFTSIDTTLAYEDQPGYQLHQTNLQAQRAIEKITTDQQMIAFDLETTGGKRVGERYIPAHITEFSFIHRDLTSGSDTIYGSIIGSTEAENKEYEDIIKKYITGTKTKDRNGNYITEGMSSEELITLKRLAKMGHANTIYEENKKSGVFHFTSFASSDDIWLMDINDIIRGKERLAEIGKRQRSDLRTYKFKGKEYEDLQTWEAQFIEALYKIYGDHQQQEIAVVGQGSRTFDINILNQFLNSGKLSENALQAVRDIVGSTNLNFDFHLDMLPLTRRYLDDSFFSESDLTQMQKMGLSRHQLETITRRLTAKVNEKGERDWSDTAYEKQGKGSAHMAETDVKMTLDTIQRLVFTEGDKDKSIERAQQDIINGILEHVADSKKLESEKGQVLLFKQHIDPRKYNLMLFVQDELSGRYRTGDKYAISDDEVENELFEQSGAQRGVTYKIEKISQLNTNEEFHKIMSRMYPGLDTSNLIALQINPLVPDSDYNIRAQSPIWYIGTRDNLQGAISDNAAFLGTWDDSGKKIIPQLTDYTKESLSRYYSFTRKELDSINSKLYAEARSEVESDIAKGIIAREEGQTDQEWQDIYNEEVDERAQAKLKRMFGESVGVSTSNLKGIRAERFIFKKSPVIEDKTGKQIEFDSTFINDIKQRALDESAARLNRKHELKKDEQLIRLIDKVDEILDQPMSDKTMDYYDITQQDTRAQREAKILSKMWGNSLKYFKNHWHKGEEAGWAHLTEQVSELLQHSFIPYFGWQIPEHQYDYDRGYNLLSETLASQYRRISWARENYDLIQSASEAARTQAKISMNQLVQANDSNKIEQSYADYWYKYIWQGIEHREQERSGLEQPLRLGWQQTGSYAYEFESKFDIDLTGFEGIPKGTIATVNLTSSPENIADQIIRASNGILLDINDAQEEEKAALLRHLQKFLTVGRGKRQLPLLSVIKQNDEGEFIAEYNPNIDYTENYKAEVEAFLRNEVGPNIITSKDSFAVASSKFYQMLENARFDNPAAGHLKSTMRHTVRDDIPIIQVSNGEVQKKVAEERITETAAREAILKERSEKIVQNIIGDAHELRGLFTRDIVHNKRVAEIQAKHVVDEILMSQSDNENIIGWDGKQGHNLILDKLEEQGHYTTQEAKTLRYIRDMHKQGLKRYAQDIFEMVGNMGGQVGWSTETGKIWASFGDNHYELELPKEIVIGDQFHYRLGRQTLSMDIGFYEQGLYKRASEPYLSLSSKIEAAVKQNSGLISWHMRQANEGEGTREFHLQQAISNINRSLRESPAVTFINEASRANQFRFDYEDVYKNIPTALSIPNLQEEFFTDAAFKDILMKLAEGKETYNPDHPEYQHMLALNANFNKIMMLVMNNFGVPQQFKDDVFKQLTIDIKPLKKSRVGQAVTYGDWDIGYDSLSRDPANVENVVLLDTQKIMDIQEKMATATDEEKRILEEEYGALKGVEFGRALTNQTMLRRSTNDEEWQPGRAVNTHVRLNAIHGNPHSINAMITGYMGQALQTLEGDKAATSEVAQDLLKSITLFNNYGVAHSQIGDNLFSTRYSLQRVAVDKTVMERDQRLLDLERLTLSNMETSIDSNNKVTFKYAPGQFVREGDELIHILGLSSRPKSERAKYSGLVKMGFFDFTSGQLVREETIARIIEESLAFDKTLREAPKEERANRILNLLTQRYQLSYYIQHDEANPMFKMNTYTEKGMTRSLVLDTGSVDEDIGRFMKSLGFRNTEIMIDEQSQILEGIGALSSEMIDSITDINGDFWTEASARYKLINKGKMLGDEERAKIIFRAQDQETRDKIIALTALTEDELDEIKQRHADKPDSAEQERFEKIDIEAKHTEKILSYVKEEENQAALLQNIRHKMLVERSGASRLLDTILRSAGVIHENDESFQVMTYFKELEKKHKELTPVRRMLDETFFRAKTQWLHDNPLQQGEDYRNYLSIANQAAAEQVQKIATKYLVGTEEEYRKYVGEDAILPKISIDQKTGQLYWQNDISPDFLRLSDTAVNAWQEEINTKFKDVPYRSNENVELRYALQRDEHGDVTGAMPVQGTTAVSPSGYLTGKISRVHEEFSLASQHYDLAKENEEAVKFGQRALTNLGANRIGAQGRTEVSTFLADRAAKYGPEAGIELFDKQIAAGDIYSALIAPMEEGSMVQQAAYDQIIRNMYNRAGNSPKLSGFFGTKDGTGDVTWGINDTAVENFVTRYRIADGNLEQGKQIVHSLLTTMRDNMGITTVNEKGAVDLMRAFNATVAHSFNAGQVSIEGAMNAGFKVVKLQDVLTGRVGAGNYDESLYSQNLIIDLNDDKMGDMMWRNAPNKIPGDNARYVAISANPTPVEEGEFREELANLPQEKIKQLKQYMEEYHEGSKNGFTGDARNRILNNIFHTVQSVRDAQYDMLSSKTGMFAEANRAYMQDATRNTARGIHLMGTEGPTGIAVHGLDELQKLATERGASIADLSMFGVNLVDEAKKGKNALQFNYSILSKKRMNDVYDKNFLDIREEFRKVLGGDSQEYQEIVSQLSDIATQTKHIAQTEGVSGISAREPLQYPGSVTQRQIYYSDIVSGNEVISDITGAEVRKEDFDADAIENAIHKEQAELNINGKKIAISVDSAMLSAINRISQQNNNISVRLLDEGAGQRFINYAQSQIYLGAGLNQRYRMIANMVEGETPTIDEFSTEQLRSYLGESTWKNLGIEEGIIPKRNGNIGQHLELQKAFDNTLRTTYQQMLADASLDQGTFGEHFILSSGAVQRAQLLQQIEKEVQEQGGKLEDSIKYQALRFSMHDKTLSSDLQARAGFAPTGIVNKYLQTVYDIAHTIFENKDTRQHLIEQGMDIGRTQQHLQLMLLATQEGFMSPKNLIGGQQTAQKTQETIQAELIPKLRTAFNEAFHLGDNATQQERDRVHKQLSDTFKDIVNARFDARELIRNPDLPSLREMLKGNGTQEELEFIKPYKNILREHLENGGQNFEQIMRSAGYKMADEVASFITDTIAWRGNERNVFYFAAHNGGGNKNLPITVPKNSANIHHKLMADVFGHMGTQLGIDNLVSVSNEIGTKSGQSKTAEIAAMRQRLNEETQRRTAERQQPAIQNDISEGAQSLMEEGKIPIKEAAKKIHGRGIMGAAVGIAGGLLISGFAGATNQPPHKKYADVSDTWGNYATPNSGLPEPATGMAAGAAMAYNTQYPTSLADSNINVIRNMPSNSYVINISGMSNTGERNARRAIGSALNTTIPQSTSINMAINNNYQDMMSQYQVDRMVQTSMGF